MEKKTKRLYFENPYQTEFEATVVQKEIENKKTVLLLDKTCFYPESGGQPADKGTLNNKPVIHVYEKGEKIYHLLQGDIEEEKVRGKVDWETRFDHMQQHAGQHILSQSFYELLKGETVSFHLGESSSTVDIGLRNISEEEVEKVEQLANKIVFENRKIKTYWVEEKELQNIPLRKPPPKEGRLRIVEVDSFDYSACGGTHPARSGEIGLIKIIKRERIRKNLRFEFLCGKRTLHDYRLKNNILTRLGQDFSASPAEVPSSVEKLLLDLKSEKKKSKKMQEKIIDYEADKLIEEAPEKIIKKVWGEKTKEEIRYLALSIIKKEKFVVLFGLKNKERVYLVLACSEGFPLDMRELIPVVSPLIKAKGGGKPSLVELAGEEKKNLKSALDKAYDFIKENYSV